MENKQKTIIIGILAIVVILLLIVIGAVLINNSNEWQTITFNDTHTSISVPAGMKLDNRIDSNGLTIETYKTSDMKTVVQRSSTGDSAMAEALKYGDGTTIQSNSPVLEYSKTVANQETGESFTIYGDREVVDKIIASIKWGNGSTANSSDSSVASTGNSGSEKTYPFICEDGSIMGYYHVGDTVSYKEMIFQLKSNGQWVQIGEANGSGQQGYDNGYQHGYDDASDSSSNSKSHDGGQSDSGGGSNSHSGQSHSGGGSDSSDGGNLE